MKRVGRRWWRQGRAICRWALRPLNDTMPPFPGSRSHLWLLGVLLVFGTAVHYGRVLPPAVTDQPSVAYATTQGLERLFFLFPVIYATVVFRTAGGMVTLLIAAGILLPKAVLSPGQIDHALPETLGILVIGALLVVAVAELRGQVAAQRRLNENLTEYARQVLSAQEGERKRIARDLHDGTMQSLLLLAQRLDVMAVASHQRPPADVSAELRALRTIALQTLTDLRRLAQVLRPRILDDLGLLPALEWLVDTVSCQHEFHVSVKAEGDMSAFSPQVELLLFRIAQEALNNAARHAGSAEATITLSRSGERISMVVADRGRGFQVVEPLSSFAASGKLGLLGMHERAHLLGGDLRIQSEPGKGTRVEVELPVGSADAPQSSDAPARNGTPSG